MVMLSAFHVPATIIVGGGARREVVAQCRRHGARRPLVVTDEGMMRLGPGAEIIALLRDAGLTVSVFSSVQPDPTDRNVLDGLAQYRADRCDAIVAIGGGSPMDAAKAIGILTNNPLPLSQYAGYHRVPQPGVPVFAIPTTAGTGSEATKVAVITDTERDVKMMMLSVHLLPTAALVDFELTMSMPPALTAAVGVDTLTHGIEAYVSRKASGMTDPLALSCVRLTATYLQRAFHDGRDRVAREGMMLAACQGGMAFANSSVCLVHGMSRPLGAIFHIPHGLSNAVLLPTVTRFSLPAAPERYATIAKILGDETGDALVNRLEQLNFDLRIPRLRECPGIVESRFRSLLPKMAEDALASGSPQNNPRIPSADEIIQLYEEAW